MMADLWTVVWKEWQDFPLRHGGVRSGWLGLLVFVGVFGVFLPLQFGRGWVGSPLALVSWAWVPLFLVISVIADTFAGERERHTLESLLSTPLPDRVILLGKIGVAVGYGWGVTMASLLLGLVTVNIAHGRGQLLLFPAPVGPGIVALSLLMAGLAASAGVLVSLRAATVRQAQQTLSFGVMLVVFVPMLGVQVLPATWKARALVALAGAGTAQSLDAGEIVLAASIALAALDAVLLAAALARFQRARLILD